MLQSGILLIQESGCGWFCHDGYCRIINKPVSERECTNQVIGLIQG